MSRLIAGYACKACVKHRTPSLIPMKSLASARGTALRSTHRAGGSVSALNYAYLLMQLPQSLIGTAIALAVFPTLSRLAAQGEREELKNLFYRSLLIIIALATAAAFFVLVLARPLVQIVYQRGAFDQAAVEVVAQTLQFYTVAIVGESALELCARIFYAQHDVRTPLWAALSAMAVNVTASLMLMGPLGIGGLALARGLALAWEAGLLLFYAHQRWFRFVWARNM